MKKLIIIGAGSVGGHIANNLELYGMSGRLAGFLDDDISKQGKTCFGYPVLGPVSWILDKEDYEVVIGIAFPEMKQRIVSLLAVNPGLQYPKMIAGNAWISENTEIGRGSIVYPGACVNYGTVVEDFVVINMNCAIGHNCHIASYCSLAPGVNLGGYTEVRRLTELGIGASTVQGVRIGQRSVVGGQAMVTESIPDQVVAVGVPARILNTAGKLPEAALHLHNVS